MQTYDSTSAVSRQDAIMMLYEGAHYYDNINNANRDRDIFDQYGNYHFPTDYVLNTPNNAYGMYGSEEYNAT